MMTKVSTRDPRWGVGEEKNNRWKKGPAVRKSSAVGSPTWGCKLPEKV